MDLPAEVLIHNAVMGLKGARGRLLQIDPEGYYEVNLAFGEKLHRVLLPIAETVVISSVPEEPETAPVEIER